MKKRLQIISFFIILFIAFISIWNFSYRDRFDEINVIENKIDNTEFSKSEQGVFERSNMGLIYKNMPKDLKHGRSLDSYYKNRAYHGAPPTIPHKVEDKIGIGDNSCLKCHQNGGYSATYSAYAPVTPHPEKINCRQCHVSVSTNSVFVQSNFVKTEPPKVGKGQNNALPGSPPAIPHGLSLRENCLACHAGPAAPKEIRVSHPERINCRQCHVTNSIKAEEIVFNRKEN